MVDNEGVDRAFGGLELKANLVFDGGEDGDYVGATGFGGDGSAGRAGDNGAAAAEGGSQSHAPPL